MIKLGQLLFLVIVFPILVSCKDTQIWTQEELTILRSLSLSSLKPVPASPSNTYADNPDAIQLGKNIFFDTRFSGNGQLSCASCHQPNRFFTDGKSVAVGVTRNLRNTSTIVGTAWNRWFYWDGRRDSLWSQALIPFESPAEMGSSRTSVVKHIYLSNEYTQAYESIFGPLPPQLFNQLPEENSGPYSDSESRKRWRKLPRPIKHQINQIYANLGKTVAAYERTLHPQRSRFDDYVDSLFSSKQKAKAKLTQNEINGLKLFIDADKTQCLQCHNGPLFTNGGFHNIGTGNFSGKAIDLGRAFGIPSLLNDEFNCLGRYSDAVKDKCTSLRFLNTKSHIPLEGAFKTPSLRNLSKTAPYFHDGSKNNLTAVLEHYNEPPANNGKHELIKLNLSKSQQKQLISFLLTLNSK